MPVRNAPAAQPVNLGVGIPAPATPAATNGGGFIFRYVPMTVVPAIKVGTRGGDRKYLELEEALRQAPAGQSLAHAIPADTDPQKYQTNILSAIRKVVPNTRCRAGIDKKTPDNPNGTDLPSLFLWIGEPLPQKSHNGKGAKS